MKFIFRILQKEQDGSIYAPVTLLFLLLLLGTLSPLQAQKTWTGTTSTNWNTGSNWLPSGVPAATDNVIIPNVANDPSISAVAVAKSVTVQAGAVLTTAAAGSLTIDGSAAAGMLNQGTVQNNGTITIGTTLGVTEYGLNNEGSFNNNLGGTLSIDNIIPTGFFSGGLYNAQSGTFTNAAEIIIGSNGTVGLNGLWNFGIFNNNMSGTIAIDRANPDFGAALYNDFDFNTEIFGTFNNLGSITIGGSTIAGSGGLFNLGVFTNNASGAISIDRTTQDGLYQFWTSFDNYGDIRIGSVGDVGSTGLYAFWDFTNHAGGSISIDRTTFVGITMDNVPLTNDGDITIGAVADVGDYGVYNAGIFDNNAGSTLSIDGSAKAAIFNTESPNFFTPSTFNNTGAITIGANATVGEYGIHNKKGSFNNTGGSISIDNIVPGFSAAGIYNEIGTFTNAAELTIGANAFAGNYGLWNVATFDNNTDGTI
jgi:hypothetical protein